VLVSSNDGEAGTGRRHEPNPELLLALWEHLPHRVIVLDGEGRIRRISPALANHIGAGEPELVGRAMAEISRDPAGRAWPPAGVTNPWWKGQLIELAAADRAGTFMRVTEASTLQTASACYQVIQLSPVGEWSSDRGFRQRELEAIAALSSAVCEPRDPDSILQVALDRAIGLLDMDLGMVGLVDGDQETVRVVARRQIAADALGDTVTFGSGAEIISAAVLTGHPLLIPDLQDTELDTPIRRLGCRGVAAAPIVLRGETVGAMVLGSLRPKEFSRRADDLLRIIGLQITIAVDHARLLRQEALRARQLEANVQELHHRVKNNLETLSAVLELARGIEGAQDLVDRLLERVETMAAVHSLMHEGTLGEKVDAAELVTQVATLVGDSCGHLGQRVTVTVNADESSLPARAATSLALITSELVSNALRHGYGQGGGEVRVRLKRSGEKVCLVVADDGSGMDEDAAPASSSMGLHIVRALVEHTLGGTLTIRRREPTKVSVRFTVAPEDGGAQEPKAAPDSSPHTAAPGTSSVAPGRA